MVLQIFSEQINKGSVRVAAQQWRSKQSAIHCTSHCTFLLHQLSVVMLHIFCQLKYSIDSTNYYIYMTGFLNKITTFSVYCAEMEHTLLRYPVYICSISRHARLQPS